MRRTCILFLTRLTTETVLARFDRLRREVGDACDVFMLLHRPAGESSDPELDARYDDRIIRFTDEDNQALVPPDAWLPMSKGGTILPALGFLAAHDYEHGWMVEHDVMYSGRWIDFFRHFEDHAAHLLACHIRDYEQEPDWNKWDRLQPAERFDGMRKVRAFMPVFRISREAARAVLDAYRSGRRGHFEALTPTWLNHIGLSMEEIGDRGPYTPMHRRGLFYTTRSDPTGSLTGWGTMRYRPSLLFWGWRSNRLYHPVKDPSEFRLLLNLVYRLVILLSLMRDVVKARGIGA